MKIIFMGTPDFAAVCLKRIAAEHEISAVFSQPDKPVGRKRILTPPAVKKTAEELGIAVFQPEKLRDESIIEQIKYMAPEAVVVVAYGRILPPDILNIPKYGCINVHASLLPKYRGAAPIQWAVINGEEETGVTTMFMNEGLDTGDMLLKEKVKIGETETSGELFGRLSEIGAELLAKTLKQLETGGLKPKKQDDGSATYAPMLDKTLCPVDFSSDAKAVCSKINGLSPWPAATTLFNGETLKIYRAQTVDMSGREGTLLDDKKLIVACKKNAVRLLEVQLVGSKQMSDEDFLRGHKIQIGSTIGI